MTNEHIALQRSVADFWTDENGFIVSAELVIIATLLVIGLVVGLSQVQHAVVSELNDVGKAIGSLNQSYYYGGFLSRKYYGGGGFGGYGGFGGGLKAYTPGSAFVDYADACDGPGSCSLACAGVAAESGSATGGTCNGTLN